MDLIPEKEYNYVMSQKLPKEPVQTKTIKERLEQLQDLKDSGLISDEEYEQKRQIILNDV